MVLVQDVAYFTSTLNLLEQTMSLPQWVRDTRETVTVPPPTGEVHSYVIAPPGEGPIKLDFSMEPQARGFWCWAAVAVSVARFYKDGKKWTQCSLATVARRQTDCCTEEVSEECNAQHPLSDVLCIVKHLRHHQAGRIPLTGVNGEPSLKSEFDDGRPVGSFIANGVGHFIVLHGCNLSAGMQMIDVADPSTDLETYSTYDYERLVNGYHGSPWSHTYFTC